MNFSKTKKRREQKWEELGAIHKEWQGRISFALAYPNTYQVGMSNLGLHILYREINKEENMLCERAFFEKSGKQVRTIESNSLLSEFQIVAFCLSFEIDGFQMVDMIRSSGIEIKSECRAEDSPLIVIGGPCPTFNPEPWAHFVDAVVIGEGEEIVKEVAFNWRSSEGLSRKERIEKLSEISGLYIPSLYSPEYDGEGRFMRLKPLEKAPRLPIAKRWIRDISEYPGYTEIVTPETEFGHMFLVEVARGCGRHCRFCMAGYAFRKPRIRPVEELLEAIRIGIEKGAKQIGLVGAAVSDHPKIDELCKAVDEAGLDLSVASLRADNVSQVLIDKLVKSGQRTITFAPETGSERMRRVINKGLHESDLLRASEKAIQSGMKHVRLYAMLGLPQEQDEDINELVQLARKIRGVMKENHHVGKVVLSVNPFIPKPFTPFERMPLTDMKIVEKKIQYLRKHLPVHEGYEIKAESLKESWVQAILARGDRRLADLILQCGERGYKNFSQIFRKEKFSKDRYEYREEMAESILPWHYLDLGVDSSYFEEELRKALAEEETIACFEGCNRCGVCE